MKIHTEITTLQVGDAVQVHSFGHLYSAKVVELKGKRARCVWTNKSGNDFDNWITIPSLSEKATNPKAAETRKLRVRATTLEKNAKGWMTRSLAQHGAQIAKLEALQAVTPAYTLDPDNTYGTQLYRFGEDEVVWGGYTVEAGKRHNRPADEIALTFEQGVQRALDHARAQLATTEQAIADALAEAAELRRQADAVVTK